MYWCVVMHGSKNKHHEDIMFEREQTMSSDSMNYSTLII